MWSNTVCSWVLCICFLAGFWMHTSVWNRVGQLDLKSSCSPKNPVHYTQMCKCCYISSVSSWWCQWENFYIAKVCMGGEITGAALPAALKSDIEASPVTNKPQASPAVTWACHAPPYRCVCVSLAELIWNFKISHKWREKPWNIQKESNYNVLLFSLFILVFLFHLL